MAQPSPLSTGNVFAEEQLPHDSTPILVLPTFDLSTMPYPSIRRAIITITEGYQSGDSLELDSNFTLVKINESTYIKHTNIRLVYDGFYPRTHQLILQGEDSNDNYAAIFESLLLDNPQGLNGDYYKISFNIVDQDGKTHRLGSSIIENNVEASTVFDQCLDNLDFVTSLTDAENDMLYVDSSSNDNQYQDSSCQFSFGHGNDIFLGRRRNENLNTICLYGINQGPSPNLTHDAEWTMSLLDNHEYFIQEGNIIFPRSASGTLGLADGSQLYFEGVDSITWLDSE